MSHPIRTAVIGAGAFGRNHLRVYRELEATTGVQLAAVVDASPETRSAASAQYNIPAFATIDDLLASGLELHAASVCVPTIHHAAVASQLLVAGLDVLIEKPFAATLAEAESVLALAKQHNRIVQIGHLERFNPAVAATVDRLNRPMFFEAHRLSLFTPRSLDVDVVLDLMIHDLDIVLSLAQSEVLDVRATGIPILSAKTDIANVRVEFASGAVANFTASRVSTEQVRKLRLFQPHQYLSLDFARQELLSIAVDPALAAQIAAGYRPPATVPASHPTTGFDLQKLDLPRAEPLRLELEDFLRAVITRQPPRVTGEAGMAALALALRINEAIAAHHERAGLLP
ncbi:MAG: Gfo/Idh/MocA family oxidoreductase [Acidobacteriaceae bacterium]|nr:Gfo/Idh/MocA family oxidoreductase [Acidobacteriaceae bacterium]